MATIYSKNSKGELVQSDTKIEEHFYTLEYLNEQKKQLTANLAWVDALILECKKAGVTLKSEKSIL